MKMTSAPKYQHEQPAHVYPATIAFGVAPQDLPAVSLTPPDPILLARLRAQVEFYFSAVNLSRDVFLRTLLQENHGSVSLERICHFPKVRELYHMHYQTDDPSVPCDPRVLQMALEGSFLVTVSEDCKWITLMDGRVAVHVIPSSPPPTMPDLSDASAVSTPVPRAPLEPPASPSSSTQTSSSAGIKTYPIPKQRTTVIVRDLSEDVILDDIVKAFTLSSGPTPKSVRRDVANTWYITFHTEQQAVQAVLETSGRFIRGDQPIRARIKSEVLVQTAGSNNQRVHSQPPASVAYTSYEYHYATMPPPPPPTPCYHVSSSPTKIQPYHPVYYTGHPHHIGPSSYCPHYEPPPHQYVYGYDPHHHCGPPPMPSAHERQQLPGIPYPTLTSSHDPPATQPLRYEPVSSFDKLRQPVPPPMVPVLDQESQKPRQQQPNRTITYSRNRKSGRAEYPFQKLDMNGVEEGNGMAKRQHARDTPDALNELDSQTTLESDEAPAPVPGMEEGRASAVVVGELPDDEQFQAEQTGLGRAGSIESSMSGSSRTSATSRSRHRSGKNSRSKKNRHKKRENRRKGNVREADPEFPELVKPTNNHKGGLKGYADALKKSKPTSLVSVPSGECTAQDQEDSAAGAHQELEQAMGKLSVEAERESNTAGGESSTEHRLEGASAAWTGKVSCSTDEDDGWGTWERL